MTVSCHLNESAEHRHVGQGPGLKITEAPQMFCTFLFRSMRTQRDNALPRFLIGLIQTWYGWLIQTWYGSGERFGKFCPLAPSLEEPFITAAEVRTNQSWIISISVHESRTVARDKMTMTSPRDNRTILCLRTRDNDSATRPSRSKVGHF